MLYGRNLPASQAPFPPPKALCQGEPKAPPNWAALLAPPGRALLGEEMGPAMQAGFYHITW